MKRFLLVILAANAVTFAIMPYAAQGNNYWIKGGCDKYGFCYYPKVISKSGPYVYYEDGWEAWSNRWESQQTTAKAFASAAGQVKPPR